MHDEISPRAVPLERLSFAADESQDIPLSSRRGPLTAIFSSIRSKIILPYLILTILVAILGTFIVTRLIAGTLEERFTNQLLEASRVAGDGIVRLEDANLEILRLMAFTIGVNEAVADSNAAGVREILEPLAANAEVDSVLVVNADGQEILGLHAVRTPQGNRAYQETQGQNLSEWPLVRPVLAGATDAYGDKYAALVNMPGGLFMFTSGPVTNEDGEVVGAILVGVGMDRVLRQLKTESLADVTLYGTNGLPLASTFPDWDDSEQQATLQISADRFRDTLAAPESKTLLDELELYERSFRAAYVPLRIRRDTLGVLGVALPSNFIVQAASTSRVSFVLFFSLATMLVVLLGLLVAQRIVKPVMRLLQVSRAITEGDLSQRVDIAVNDELGVLARSFDTMTAHLEERTHQLEERTIQLGQEIARARAILRSLADGVIVHDNEGEIIMINTAAQALLSRTSRHQRDTLFQVGTRSAGDGKDTTPDAAAPHRVELGDRVVSARVAPVLTEKGRTVGNVLVMRDVTREAAAERLKDDFVNNISHELRTPLTVIKGYSDLLRMAPERIHDDSYERATGAIFVNAELLEGMITKLIDLSEMDAGTLALDMDRVSFNQLVQQTLAEWDSALKEARLNPELHMEAETLVINADEYRLRWVLDAILENARQYCVEGGDLNLTLSQMGSAAVLQIEDQGVGISGEDLPHVFQRFYRGKPLGPDGNLIDPRGMGQGLYVVKSVVEAHAGRVWVESEVGKGSQFSILLPLAQYDAAS
jgi:two-component system sensor histidine kinase ResE